MISEKHFRLKKNGEPDCKCFCKDVTRVENYSRAVLDTSQIWECHHRRETHYLKDGKWVRRDEDLTVEQLKEEGVYYNVPPSELIFLTPTEHKSLHNKGKKLSEEHKRKVGKAFSKKVLCIETGEVFESSREAERKTGVAQSHISSVCNGKQKTAGGYHWTYAP